MAKKNSTTKLFVLDTNVLMHDPSSIFRFEEHDIYLPMVTLEELDNNKKGVSEVARNLEFEWPMIVKQIYIYGITIHC